MSLRIDRVQLDIIINGDQSRIKLRELEEQAGKLKRELAKLPKESEEYVRKSAELRKVQGEIDGIINKIGILGLTYKELAARQRELNMIMKNLDPRTPQYKELDGQLQKVNARMRELKGGAQATGLSFSKVADGFNKYFGVITAFVATFSGVIFGFRKAIDAFNEFEKGLSNLSALTGLEGDNLKWLGEQAKLLSTSTTESGVKITASATDILEAYKLMGSAKPELLENKEALNEVTKQALILAEAADMETRPAVEALASVMNQFGADATQASKYINVMAAGAKAGAAEIPDISASIIKFGAAAKQANVSVEESVALIEALSEKGIKGEIAGTGIRNVLLELQKGADDTNPKVVGINQALENLAKKNLSAAQMMEIFGKENYTVAQILVQSTDRVNDLEKAVTNTSMATEQAVKNTNNNAAALEQAKNRFQLTAIALGEKLAPALTFSTNGFSYLMKAILAIIEVFKEHGTLILSAAAGIATYTVAINANTIATKAHELATKLATRATSLFQSVSKFNPWALIAAAVMAAVVAIIAYSRQLTAAQKTQRMLNDLATEAKKNIVSEKLEIEKLLAIAKDETKSKEDRLAAIKKLNQLSPEYLGNLNLENINTTAAKEATEKYIAVLEKKALIQAAQEKLIDIEKEFIDLKEQGTGAEIKWYQAAWNSITAMGDIGGMVQKNANTAVKNYNKAFDELAAKKKALLGILSEEAPQKATAAPTIDAPPETPTPDTKSNDAYKKQLEEQQKYIEELILKSKTLTEQENIAYQERLKKAGLFGKDKAKLTEKQLIALEYLEKQHGENIEKINKDLNDQSKAEKERIFTESEKALKKQFAINLLNLQNAELKKLETEGTSNAKRIDIQKEFADEREDMEFAHLLMMRELLVKNGKDTLEIDEQINSERLKKFKKGRADLQDALEEAKQKEFDLEKSDQFTKGDIKGSGDYLKDVSDLEKSAAEAEFQFKLEQLERQHEAEMNSEFLTAEEKERLHREYLERRAQLEKEFNERSSNRYIQTANTVVTAIDGIKNLELSLAKDKYDADMAELDNLYSRKLISEDTYNKKKTALDENYKKKEKAINKKYSGIEFAVKVANIIASTAMAIMQSYAKLGPIAGSIAAISMGIVGATQLAIATTEKNKVEQMYTGRIPVIGASDGKSYNVPYAGKMKTGIYPRPVLVSEQGGEMVVDAETTNDLVVNYPGIVRFIHGLSGKRVRQYADGSYPSVNGNSQGSGSDSEMLLQLVMANTSAINRLNDLMSKGILAKIIMDEFKQAESEYNDLKSNVRKR